MANWSYVRRASPVEKAAMLETIVAENDFQQKEPHGEWLEYTDENGEAQQVQCPIVFRLENHDGYQMQAYTPDGRMMDNSYHYSFVRCKKCHQIVTYYGDANVCICGEELD